MGDLTAGLSSTSRADPYITQWLFSRICSWCHENNLL